MQEKIEELTVERLNVVGKDGQPRVVISNEDRFPEPRLDGQEFPRSGGAAPGFIFYNQRGDECGGLLFSSSDEEPVTAGALFTFDQYRQDQVLQLSYSQQADKRTYGFVLTDHETTPITEWIAQREAAQKLPEGPEREAALEEAGPWGIDRLFLGRSYNGAYVLEIKDSNGKPRLRLGVGEDDEPRIEFLDAEGNVTYSLPPT